MIFLARLKRKNDMTIESLYASLDPLEREFFSYLDSELEKVDKFYDERETAAVFRFVLAFSSSTIGIYYSNIG